MLGVMIRPKSVFFKHSTHNVLSLRLLFLMSHLLMIIIVIHQTCLHSFEFQTTEQLVLQVCHIHNLVNHPKCLMLSKGNYSYYKECSKTKHTCSLTLVLLLTFRLSVFVF
jgi:hypothetical protein